MITVFFDRRCGLCRREIEFYSRIAPKGRFRWLDVFESERLLASHGIELGTALLALHAVDDKGEVVTGVGAFITIWREIRGFRWLSGLAGCPLFRPIAGYVYSLFGALRFKAHGYDRCDL